MPVGNGSGGRFVLLGEGEEKDMMQKQDVWCRKSDRMAQYMCSGGRGNATLRS